MTTLSLTKKMSVLLVKLLIVSLCFNCEPEKETFKNTNLPDQPDTTQNDMSNQQDTLEDSFDYSKIRGCDGQYYMDPTSSMFILPFKVGYSFYTGLTNCSSSYHASGQPDQYAFDFNMPENTEFIASRAGTVTYVENSQSSDGGGVGNYVYIDHHDGTYGLYYHSPKGGIKVKTGDKVKQGQVLGMTGKSGLAGYPHLHFIVVQSPPNWPYKGIPISFSNSQPLDVPLKGSTKYTAKKY